MPTLPKFVIDLDRLREDVSKTSSLLTKLGSDIKIAGFHTPGFDFLLQANVMLVFPETLRLFIESHVALLEKNDIFGNKWEGYNAYRFIEIAVDPTYNTLTAVRLLGDVDKPLLEQTRFAFFDADNLVFTPTTINTVSDVREISDGITEFFGASSADVPCGQGNDTGEEPLSFDNFLSQVRVTSNLTWSDYIRDYVIPRVKVLPLGTDDELTCGGEVFAALLSEFESKTFKTDEEKLAEEEAWGSVAFKERIAGMQDKCFDLVNSSAEILADPGALADKIQTLADAYSEFFDKISLECLIKSAMECIIPPLTCRETLAGLRLNEIEEKIELAFPNLPRVADIVKREAAAARAANQDEVDAADAFLNNIENFIDLEAVCDASKFNLAFSIPTIELPELPIIDLFASVEIAIEDAILSALITAIVEMLLGILEDLQSCDNLDAFIAGALNGQIPTDSELNDDLNRLFGLINELDDASLPVSADVTLSLGARWENFVNQAEPLLDEQVKLELQSGADVLGGATQLRAQLDDQGGLGGLLATVEGNIGAEAGRVVFEAFFQGQINFSQLLRFQGEESASALSAFFNEIGLYVIDEEEKSFILRVSDEQSIVIFSAIGKAPKVPLDTSGKELADAVGDLLNDTVAILSPGDTLNLLAGTPSERTVEVIIELIKISHVEISFINKPDQVITLFKTLGDATGTSAMKDGVILAANVRRTRDIPRKFCPEDDEAIMLQEEILTRSFPPEEVRTIIDEIIEKRRVRYNELGDILVRLNEDDFSPNEVLEPILCGLQPDGTRPAVVDAALDMTINTIFEPTKMAFDREIPRYPDALSSEEKVIRLVPRTIRRSGERPVFGAGDDNLFGNFSDFLGSIGVDSPFNDEGKTEKIINPEWARLISQGMVPPDDDPGAREDEFGPFTHGPPVPVQDVVKRVGANFKRAFRFEDAVELKQASSNSFEVQIKGSLPVQSPVQQFSPVPTVAPSWFISYKEKNQALSLALSAQGTLFSPRVGRIPFSDNFYFAEDFSRDLDPDVLERVEQLNEIVDGNNSKPDIFSGLLKAKLRPAVRTTDLAVFEGTAEPYFKDRYEEFIKGFLTNAGKRVANNRLLKKIPNQSLNHLGPGASEFNSKEETETLIINLINFSATPTDGQKRCKADPHLLDLEFIKSIVKSEYDKDCEIESNNDGVSRSRGPVNSSGFVGVVLTIVRLYVIEYILRGLFVFDEYGYKIDFADDQLLISYVSFRLKRDIARQGNLDQGGSYYDAFERETKIAYRKLVENEAFDLPTEPLPPPGSDGVPSELKVLVKEQMKAVLEKIGEIVGINPDVAGENLIKDLLSNLPRLDTFSVFGDGSREDSDYTSVDARLSSLFQPEPKESIPFPPIPAPVAALEDGEGKYAIERYIRIPRSSNNALSSQQENSGLLDVVNFKNWEEFLDNNPQVRNERVDELFDEPWMYGYRLVFISPISGESSTAEDIRNAGKKFKFNGPVKVDLNDSLSTSEKAFHILERDPQPPTLAEAAGDAAEDAAGKLDDFLGAFGLDTNVGDTVGGIVDDLVEPEPPVFKQFNTVPIAQVEVPVDDFAQMKDAEGKIQRTFERDYGPSLLEDLADAIDTRTLFDYCFFSKRLVTFMLIQSSMVLNSEDMKFLFEGTKIELKKLFNILQNMGDYTSKSEGQFLDGVPGNAGAYKADFDQIGSPSGPKGPDAFYLASITPILILRGLAELIDPNIAITAKVVAAGNAGYLLPKFARNTDGSIKLSGSENNPGPPVIQFAPVGVINPNDGFECILRASDDLPSWVEDGTLVEWKAPDVPTIPGLPPLVLPSPEEPLFIPRGPNGELFGLDRSADTENPGAIVASVPEFPGESVNLPYGLVSLALLPLQLFFPILGAFCGPPYNTSLPLGIDFLRLEPLIYQLPSYKFAFEETDVAAELLASEGIDLSGAKNVKCKDDTDPPESPDTAQPDSDFPPPSDSC